MQPEQEHIWKGKPHFPQNTLLSSRSYCREREWSVRGPATLTDSPGACNERRVGIALCSWAVGPQRPLCPLLHPHTSETIQKQLLHDKSAHTGWIRCHAGPACLPVTAKHLLLQTWREKPAMSEKTDLRAWWPPSACCRGGHTWLWRGVWMPGMGGALG